MGATNERYRWARQPTVRNHLRDVALWDAWHAMQDTPPKPPAAAPPSPAPTAPTAPATTDARTPQGWIAAAREDLDYLWALWLSEAEGAARDGRPAPSMAEAATLADMEGWGRE
jgi:hypothetical protein